MNWASKVKGNCPQRLQKQWRPKPKKVQTFAFYLKINFKIERNFITNFRFPPNISEWSNFPNRLRKICPWYLWIVYFNSVSDANIWALLFWGCFFLFVLILFFFWYNNRQSSICFTSCYRYQNLRKMEGWIFTSCLPLWNICYISDY